MMWVWCWTMCIFLSTCRNLIKILVSQQNNCCLEFRGGCLWTSLVVIWGASNLLLEVVLFLEDLSWATVVMPSLSPTACKKSFNVQTVHYGGAQKWTLPCRLHGHAFSSLCTLSTWVCICSQAGNCMCNLVHVCPLAIVHSLHILAVTPFPWAPSCSVQVGGEYFIHAWWWSKKFYHLQELVHIVTVGFTTYIYLIYIYSWLTWPNCPKYIYSYYFSSHIPPIFSGRLTWALEIFVAKLYSKPVLS